jgi:hypothetical protein
MSSHVGSDFYEMQKEFAYLHSFQLSRKMDEVFCSDYILRIVLCGQPYKETDKEMLLTFSGVKNLKIGDLGGMVRLFIHVLDIADSQMEGITYKVSEEENELFSFYCQKVEYEITEFIGTDALK